MANVERKVYVAWEGSLASGNGSVTGDSSKAIGEIPVTWVSRV